MNCADLDVVDMMFGRGETLHGLDYNYKHERDHDAASSSGSDGVPQNEKAVLGGYT